VSSDHWLFNYIAPSTAICNTLWGAYTDIDFAAYGKQTSAVRICLKSGDNKEVFCLGERAIFDRTDIGLHVDIFYEKLISPCNPLEQPEVDRPSIPWQSPAEKMRSWRSPKDVTDTIMPYWSTPATLTKKRSTLRVAHCAPDWGLAHDDNDPTRCKACLAG
jgi:hypothetical protein